MAVLFLVRIKAPSIPSNDLAELCIILKERNDTFHQTFSSDALNETELNVISALPYAIAGAFSMGALWKDVYPTIKNVSSVFKESSILIIKNLCSFCIFIDSLGVIYHFIDPK
ncbi:MAG: hypothetical protein QW303_04890 [Nitrososphaerota archaeon]